MLINCNSFLTMCLPNVYAYLEEIRTDNLCQRAFVILYQKALINHVKIYNNV